MPKLKAAPVEETMEKSIHPDMPNHVGSEAELLAALSRGDADIEAGRTLSLEELTGILHRRRETA